MTDKEALMINNNIQMILKQCNRQYYEIYYDLVKAYDTVNHMWLINVLEKYKISRKIINVIKDIIHKWNIEVYYNNNNIGQITLRNGILQGDTMSPLLFIMCIDQ